MMNDAVRELRFRALDLILGQNGVSDTTERQIGDAEKIFQFCIARGLNATIANDRFSIFEKCYTQQGDLSFALNKSEELLEYIYQK